MSQAASSPVTELFADAGCAAGGCSDDPAIACGRPIAPEALVRVLPIINKRGLHARASAKFVQTVERFDAMVTVCRSGEAVGGNSIMGLMMLAAGPGCRIDITATGEEAEEAVTALADLVSRRFDEER